MNRLAFLLLISTVLLFVGDLIAQSSLYTDYIPTIPSERRVDRHNVGDKEKPTSYDAIFNVLNYGAIPNDGSDDRQAIQNAIDSARVYNLSHPGSFCAVYLPEGTYDIISGSISFINAGAVDYSNICLKGRRFG